MSISNRNQILVCLLMAVALALFISCDEPNEQHDPQPTICLSIESAWLTSITLKVEVDVENEPWSFSISNDAGFFSEFNVVGIDTIIKIIGLEPGHEYNFVATLTYLVTPQNISTQLLATTLNATSHDFTWEYHYPPYQGSATDAWPSANDEIWLVGEFDSDTTTPWISDEYQCLLWNGDLWNPVPMENGVDVVSIHQNEYSQMWALGYSGLWQYDDNQWLDLSNNLPGDQFLVSKIWSPVPDVIFFGSAMGQIIRYSNGNSEIIGCMDSEFIIMEIDGNDPEDFFVNGFIPMCFGEASWRQFRITDNVCSRLNLKDSVPDYYNFSSRSFTIHSDTAYFATDDGMWLLDTEYNDLRFVDVLDSADYVRTQGYNDIILTREVDDGIKFQHFNGLDWSSDFIPFQIHINFIPFQIHINSVKFENDIIAIAGSYAQGGWPYYPVLILGKR